MENFRNALIGIFTESALLLRFVGYLGAMFIAGFGIWQYQDSMEKQFHKPIWEKQVETYYQLIELSSQVARSSGDKQEEAIHAFRELLYGPSFLFFGDNLVWSEAGKLQDALIKCEHGTGGCDLKALATYPTLIARACRESLGRSWDSRLDDFSSQDWLKSYE